MGTIVLCQVFGPKLTLYVFMPLVLSLFKWLTPYVNNDNYYYYYLICITPYGRSQAKYDFSELKSKN